jgi:glycine dehydrogenase subunit 2
MDRFIAAFQSVSDEAYTDPEIVKTAPHRCASHKIDHSRLDDPDRIFFTWKSYTEKK